VRNLFCRLDVGIIHGVLCANDAADCQSTQFGQNSLFYQISLVKNASQLRTTATTKAEEEEVRIEFPVIC